MSGDSSASPRKISGSDGFLDASLGLTKREWFVGKILEGLLANPDISRTMTTNKISPEDARYSYGVAARRQADEVLEQLERDS